MKGNLPTVASVVTGLITALGGWGLTYLSEQSVPMEVVSSLGGVVLLGGAIVGGIAGKLAQRVTWKPETVAAKQNDWWMEGFQEAQKGTTLNPDVPAQDPSPADDPVSGKANK